LSGLDGSHGFGLEQAIDWPGMHQVGADQSGEGERALNDFLSGWPAFTGASRNNEDARFLFSDRSRGGGSVREQR
jgi:hypothetical protein